MTKILGAAAMARRVVFSLVVCACMGACSRPSSTPVARPHVSTQEREVIIQGRRLRYHLQLAEQPNLVYQLDCVAGVALCAQVIFLELWETFKLSSADRAALATWKSLRSRYGGKFRRVDTTRPPQRLLAPAGVFDLAERHRIAGLRARTPAMFQETIALLSTNEDAFELEKVMERFAGRFSVWWRERGFAAGAVSFAGFERLLADPFLDDTIDKVARFYEADLPAGATFPIHLVVQPRSARRLSVAYQLEGDAVIEVRKDAPPEFGIEIVAHELFHYFFFRMAPERQAALLDEVSTSEEPYAVVSFGMIDEAVATALGNGIVGHHYRPPAVFEARRARGFIQQYRAAGLLARELYAVLPAFLDRGITISSREFLRSFYAAARATYPDGRPRPLDYLHSQISVAEPRFAGAVKRLHEVTSAGFPNLREYASLDGEALGFLVAHPLINSALFLPSNEPLTALLQPLDPGMEHVATITALARRGQGFVYAMPRTDKSYAFLFVGATESVMMELVERFAALTTGGEGLLVELKP